MILKVAFNDDSESLVVELRKLIPDRYPLLKLETYQEEMFRERKKAFGLKYMFGTKIAPFAVLYDYENNPVKAFYSDTNECTLDNIIKSLNSFIAYEGTSNQQVTE